MAGQNGGVMPLRQVPKGPIDVTLLTFSGAKLAACVPHMSREITYAGKLWALNDQFSQASKAPVFVEVNDAVIAELRTNANMTLGIAERWEKQLAELQAESVVKQ